MKLIILSACLILFAIRASAQEVVLGNQDETDVSHVIDMFVGGGGVVWKNDKYANLSSGSPFFRDQFMKGTLYDAAGNRYSGVVRLNLMDNQVNYLGAGEKEMVCTSPIKRMTLTDTVTGAKYSFILGDQLHSAHSGLETEWIQVLVNGPVSLCLEQKKSLRHTIPYATTTTVESIEDVSYYYLNIHGNFTRLKGWQDLQDQLSDKKDAVDQFIKGHHLRGRSADDYIQVVTFYNAQS